MRSNRSMIQSNLKHVDTSRLAHVGNPACAVKVPSSIETPSFPVINTLHFLSGFWANTEIKQTAKKQKRAKRTLVKMTEVEEYLK